MKIENNQTNRLVQSQTESAVPVERNPRAAETDRTDNLAAKDQASFSDRAKLMSKVSNALDAVPDVRTERVNMLREQVSSGNYQIPIEALAKRLSSKFSLE